MKNIIDSFDYFLKSNELGKTDAKNINRLLQMIDTDGYIEKQVVLDELFKKAANADANYRNFVKRVRDAIDNAQAEDGDLTGRKILESIEVNIVKASKTQPTRLQLTTRYVAPIVVQPEANRQYDESNFQENTVKDIGNDIKIFISYSKEDEALVNDFKELFTSRAPYINERRVEIWTMQELTFGNTFDWQIQQNLHSADFGLAALSQNFLESAYIKEKEVSYLLDNNRLLLFGLDAKIDGKGVNVGEFFTKMKKTLPTKDIHQQTLQQQVCYLDDRVGNFFGDCKDKDSKIKFVDKVINDLKKVIEKQEKARQKERKDIEDLRKDGRGKNYEDCAFVHNQVRSIRVKNQIEELTDKDTQSDTSEYKLIPDMLTWAQNSDQSIYAILGDYGMGKTFSCRIFAKELAGTKITPFYIDLRDTPTFVTKDNIVRQPLLEEIIDNVLGRQNIKTQAQDFIQQAQDGTLIFIFDGLDEKLVHYNQDMRQQFLSELMRVFPVDTFRSQSKVKMVLSCRTHHFEDLKAQSSFLRGLGRTDSASEDYRAVEILPFNALQIESLLEKQLGNKSRIVFELINDNRYLANLAKRPFLLTRIAQVLPTLQTLRVINSAAVYQALIDDAIDRDEGKHILRPRHKRILLQDLSAELWQQSEQILMVDELNEWYQSWLHSNTSILQQYDKVSNSELERDLRNSTLLVRFGEEDFGFTHSSMQEFFLAQWILKNWRQLLGDFKLNKAISPLTRQFILDGILLLKPKEIKQLKQALKDSLQQKNTSELTHLALDIVSTMSKEMDITLDFECVDLSYLKVKQLFVTGLKTKELILSHSDLPASHWQNVEIATVKINNSNLNQSVWRDCVLQDLHTDFNFKIDDVLHSGMHQWTVDNCQFEFEHTAFSKALQWHIYANSHKLKTSSVQNLSQFDFLQTGHSNAVSSANFSPDGQTIISASFDNTLKLWNLNGQCLHTFTGHSSEVLSANFSPDGQTIISASFDNTLKLWNLNGQCLHTFTGHSGGVPNANFSPDGQTIISASFDNTLKLWNLNGQCLHTFTGHSGGVPNANFSPDGQTIISASFDNTLKLWNLNGQCLHTFTGHSGGVPNANFSPDGQTIISASFDNTLKLWNLNGQCLHTFTGHSGGVPNANFSPDGQTIISASFDNTLKLWNLNGQCLHTFTGHSGGVPNANFSPDGQTIISASFDNTLKLWNLNGQCLHTFTGHSGGVPNANFSPDGQTIISASWDNTLKLWNLNGQCLHTFTGHSSEVLSANFSPDGQTIISTSFDNTLKLWNLNGRCLHTFTGHSGVVPNANFSPDGQTIVSASDDTTLKLWNLNGQCLHTFTGHSSEVLSANFSPDGQTIISASFDNTLKLWNLNGQCLHTFTGHSSWIQDTNFSPDGQTIVSVSGDRTLKLWNLNGQCLHTFTGHSNWVQSANFSPDGQTIISASYDNTLKLWNLNGRCLHTFTGHSGGVPNANFSPDGQTIVSSGGEIICLWHKNQLQQWWTNDCHLSIHNNKITKIRATATAWQQFNLSNGKQTANIDDLENFELFESN